MKQISLLLLVTCAILAGCAGANITSANWNDPGIKGVNAQRRCERVDMRNNDDMKTVFGKYDGWKLIYISEYTTSNKVGTDAAVCFERSK